MTDKEKEVLSGFLKKIYGVTDEDLASLYNEAGELANVDSILQKDSERVLKFKTEKDGQFKAGQKKASEIFEKHLKEHYNVESDLIGTELIDHVFETKTSELTEKLNKKFNSDDLEKHPFYISKRAEWEKNMKARDKEWEDKITAKESEWNKKQTFNQVLKVALTDVETNFILPENPQRAAALKDVLARELESENYSLLEDGTIMILDKEGKVKEDQHGKPVQFKDFTEALSSKYFDKKVANQRSNSSNQQQQTQGQTIVIKDQSELQAKMAEAKTPEERAAVTKAAKAAGFM